MFYSAPCLPVCEEMSEPRGGHSENCDLKEKKESISVKQREKVGDDMVNGKC